MNIVGKVFAGEGPPDFTGGGVEPPDIPLFEGGFAGLASTGLRFLYIIAGIYAMFNFVIAGYQFMSGGGDPEAIGKAWGTIWKSLVGLLIIVSSTVFAALIGWLFLDNPTAILAPEFNIPTPIQ